MLKIIRIALYTLAISTGVAGLFVGGTPLVKYARQWLHDHEYGYYYDPNYLFSPEVIFILSVILLVFVQVSFLVGKNIHITSSEKSDSPTKPVENPAATAEKNLQPTQVAGTTTPTEKETADEKLARLLRQKKD